MNKALALLEFDSVATGVLAVDRMLKKSPVALLRCGTVHPGRYLALVGGTVAATEEAHAEGTAVGKETGSLVDQVLLADPHPALNTGLVGDRRDPTGDTLAILETATCPAMLRSVDALLKGVPVQLSKLRLADDLGGKSMAVLTGELTDLQEAVARAGAEGALINASIMARMDETLRKAVSESTAFHKCRNWTPDGAETLED